MFKHILVPVDGSETSLSAVDKAIGLAKAFDSEVTAIYVIDPYPFTGVGADFAYGQDQYLGAAKAEANAAVEAVAQRLTAAGLKADTRIVKVEITISRTEKWQVRGESGQHTETSYTGVDGRYPAPRRCGLHSREVGAGQEPCGAHQHAAWRHRCGPVSLCGVVSA